MDTNRSLSALWIRSIKLMERQIDERPEPAR
jgi:hypothetical protein